MGRLIILSGPSCIGKGPLHAALKKFHPEWAEKMQPVVLYNSRPPRPSERDGVDYHFRPRSDIEALRERPGFHVMDVRGDLQALDLDNLRRSLDAADVFFEGNPFVGSELLKLRSHTPVVSALLSPLSRDEIRYLRSQTPPVNLETFVTDIMRRKLLRRTQRQKGILSLPDLEEIERRCRSAYSEMKLAWRFGTVIPNHDGEDSENWNAFYHPVGDAWKTLQAFVALLEGRTTPVMEQWDEHTLEEG